MAVSWSTESGDERQLTYAELDRLSSSVGGRLRALGVGPEVGVGVHLERTPEQVVTVLGVLRAGGYFVPLSPSQPPARRRQVAREAGLGLVVEGRGAALEDFAGRRLSWGTELRWEELASGGEAPGVEASGLESTGLESTGAERSAYALFTSGSTGTPKGVLVSHRALMQRVGWMVEELGPQVGSRVLYKTPLVFDASLWELFLPWQVGGRVELAAAGSEGDGAALVRQVRERGIGTLQLVPSLLQAVAGEPGLESCTCLRWLFCGGEALPRELVRRVVRRCPWLEVHNTYGPTEAAIDVTHRRARGGAAGIEELGRPLPRATAYVVDGAGRPVPAGVVGELWLGGEQLARGYLGRAGWTAAAFVPDPFTDTAGGRLYRSGDLARWSAHGELRFEGRRDAQVKLRGQRLELGEVESVLGSHPAVREAAAAVQGEVLVGYAVAREETETAAGAPSEEALRGWLEARLPGYMVPGRLLWLEALPRTAGGKLDRRALPAPAAPEDAGSRAARTVDEEVVAQIFAAVLGLERAPGAEESFFALGGHSLLATQVVSRLREGFGVEVALRRLFEAPTVAGLAAEVARQRREREPVSAPPPLVRRERPEAGWPLSFAQQRLWFLEQLDAGGSAYHLSVALELRGALEAVVLEAALAQVVRRQEVLRSWVVEVDGEPRMAVAAVDGALPLSRVDLSRVPEAGWRQAVRRWARVEAQRPFALAQGPLWRAVLLHRDASRHALVLTLHHLVADGWSLGVLLRELAAAYEAGLAGRRPRLPALPVRYGDYASWQREWLQGEVLEEQLAWWREELAGAPRVLELPADRPRPPVQSTRGAAVELSLPAAAVAELTALARREGATPFMVLLAGFAVLLARWSGQDDLLVGTPVAGRNRLPLEPLVGVFVNTLVLRTRVGRAASFRDLLAAVRRTLLDATARAELPFERLVEDLGVHRDLSRSPLFQVMLAFNNAPLPRLEIGDLDLAPLPVDRHTAQHDLTVDLRAVAGRRVDGGGGVLQRPLRTRHRRALCAAPGASARGGRRGAGEAAGRSAADHRRRAAPAARRAGPGRRPAGDRAVAQRSSQPARRSSRRRRPWSWAGVADVLAAGLTYARC